MSNPPKILAYLTKDQTAVINLQGAVLADALGNPREGYRWKSHLSQKESVGRSTFPADALREAARAEGWTLVQLYPDTEAGALACLREDSPINLAGATAKPDPYVKGVWEVTTAGGLRAIVYLAGYRDPFGYVRASNDFAMSVPTTNELRRAARVARDLKRAQAQVELSELSKDDDAREILDRIWATMRRSANDGGMSCDINLRSVFGEEGERLELRNTVWRLLQDMGHSLRPSYSSNYCNERWFISWDPKVKTEED